MTAVRVYEAHGLGERIEMGSSRLISPFSFVAEIPPQIHEGWDPTFAAFSEVTRDHGTQFELIGIARGMEIFLRLLISKISLKFHIPYSGTLYDPKTLKRRVTGSLQQAVSLVDQKSFVVAVS
ncbi:MAG: hypothetical protein PVI71_07390 [Desulfobacterales bacterium]|jgi:hypothetical protein